MAEQTWTQLIASSAGYYHIFASKLATPITLTYQANVQVEAASTIKLAIFLALLEAVEQKRLSLRKQIELKRSFVGRNGSGLLQSMYFNAPFTLYNLAFLMMSV